MAAIQSEILAALKGGRAPYLPTPVILCGLGDYGIAVNEKLRRRLLELPGLANPDVITFLNIRHLSKAGPIGLDKRKSENGWDITCRAAAADRRQLSAGMVALTEKIGALFQETAFQLLDKAGLNRLEANKLNLVVVGDSRDLAGSVGGVDLAVTARRYLQGFIANLNLSKTGVFLLPKGASPRGARVYAFLKDLQRYVDRRGEALYDYCFLISPTNESGLLNDGGTYELAAEFLLLFLSESRDAIEQQFAAGRGSLASFGLSCLVYPAADMVKEAVGKFAVELIESEILKTEEHYFAKAAAEFRRAAALDGDGLLSGLDNSTGGALTDEVEIDPLYFSRVDMRHWPDRIASYNAFLESEKTGLLLGKLEENLKEVYQRSRRAVRNKVDELLNDEPNIKRARDFLLELRRELEEERNLALRRQDELIKSLPSTEKHYKRLKKKIQHLPYLSALAARILILSVLTFFLTARVVELLRRIPPRYFNSRYLPGADTAGLLAAAAVILLGWLIYKRAEASMFQARDAFLAAVEERHKYIINWWIRQKIIWLLSAGDLPELRERKIDSLIGVVDEELAALERLRRLYLKVLVDFERGGGTFTASKIRRSLPAAFNLKIEVKYKRGRFSRTEEANLFVAAGGHRDWRRLNKKTLADRLVDFISKGFKYTDFSSAQRVISEVSAGRARVNKVFSDLRRSSQPYIILTPSRPQVVEMVASAFPEHLDDLRGLYPGRAALISHPDRNSLGYLQMVKFELENISSLSLWRRSYQSRANKATLHCRDRDEVRDELGYNQAAGGSR